MALGVDSQVTPRGKPVPVLDSGWQDGVKIKLLQDRIGVATVYTGYYTARGRTIYDFHAWIRKIENAVAENMRVVEFAKLFEEQCRNNFDQFGQLVMKGHSQIRSRTVSRSLAF